MSERTGFWRALLAPPVLALQFLTAVPVPLAVPAGPQHLGRAVALFPLVGAALGVALAGMDALARGVLPPLVSSVLVLGAATLLTGGLHLDGLMDACDGLFGGRTVERRLEIMRDSRVGSFGVLGGGLQLLLKVTTLAALPADVRGGALILSLVAGRWSLAGALYLFPYARPTGLGALFRAGLRWPSLVLAALLSAGLSWLTVGWRGVLLLLFASAVALLAARWMAGRLGGALTGDTYGAVNEIAEVAVLLPVLALQGGQGGG